MTELGRAYDKQIEDFDKIIGRVSSEKSKIFNFIKTVFELDDHDLIIEEEIIPKYSSKLQRLYEQGDEVDEDKLDGTWVEMFEELHNKTMKLFKRILLKGE